jgi:DNA polymerase III psi subunit
MYYLGRSPPYIVILNMLNQNNTSKLNQTQHALAIMGITQWQLREVILTSPNHSECVFNLNLTQSLSASEQTFLVKLYQAIEKLLGLSPSEYLTQTQSIQPLLPKVKLIFNANLIAPAIREQTPNLIIDLPGVYQCESNPAIKSALWKLLKDKIKN